MWKGPLNKGIYDDICNGYIQRVSIPVGQTNMACLKSVSAVSSGVFRLTFMDGDGHRKIRPYSGFLKNLVFHTGYFLRNKLLCVWITSLWLFCSDALLLFVIHNQRDSS